MLIGFRMACTQVSLHLQEKDSIKTQTIYAQREVSDHRIRKSDISRRKAFSSAYFKPLLSTERSVFNKLFMPLCPVLD